MRTLATRPASFQQWKKATLLVPGILILGVASASAGDRITQHFRVDPHPVVAIHNPSGTVTVRAWTKSEVMVVAERTTTESEVDATQTGNRIDVVTRPVSETAAPGDLRTDLEISVPQDAELEIHDDAGGVNVSNVLGDMNVETIAAGVDLEDAAGYLTVKTVDGSFQCVRCTGRIEVSSISGNFRFIDIHSPYVRAQTSTGNILFNGGFLPDATYRLKNYSGVIEVRFSPGDSFDLSASSIKGHVHNEARLDPPSHHHFLPRLGTALFGTLNSGRASVQLSSFDGTINILKRD
ncbi:MAG TPA: DUF4097 family beta strand repeat-containing protein [Candidatus Acidoferrales bacterium]|jgi:DUF4097 and DUF4098 domain-containing protein YvlB|nr:DUF4097 family beta strand repeat-containing protein [Candidatus Acidoferrales bacterium]